MTVTGVVTAQPGRILGERTMAIQDGTGGIFVRLPDAVPLDDLPQARIVRVSGELAAPYGNLELRPGDESDVVALGSGGLPEPLALSSARVAEETEGLLVTMTGTIVDVERRDSGALSLVVRDDDGSAQVYLHAELGMSEISFEPGQRIRTRGIVGQRASRSGAMDGHRIWPRGQADIEWLGAEDPEATPRPHQGCDPRLDADHRRHGHLEGWLHRLGRPAGHGAGPQRRHPAQVPR